MGEIVLETAKLRKIRILLDVQSLLYSVMHRMITRLWQVHSMV